MGKVRRLWTASDCRRPQRKEMKSRRRQQETVTTATLLLVGQLRMGQIIDMALYNNNVFSYNKNVLFIRPAYCRSTDDEFHVLSCYFDS